MVKIKNEEAYEKIGEILETLYSKGICNDVREDGVFYVSAYDDENLKEIKYYIDKNFECETDFIKPCFTPWATPCEDWIPDEESNEWCLNECKKTMLEINTNKKVDDKEFIRLVFEEV